MDTPTIDLVAEKKEILKRYRTLLKSNASRMEKGDKVIIRKAFELAVDAHKDMRRKSGEPYIYHPIAVAQIAVSEIGLGTTAIVCSLLHDTVEDTDISLEDIKGMFGEKIMKIIDGLTKISGVFDQTSSLQAENFRKMLLTLSDDIRVILIKLADRLHNMRTLDSMARDKQVKIASETLYLYAPLAHRLGLNAIKTEMEDLGLKYTEPEAYNSISQKLKETQKERTRYINKFSLPIINTLTEQGFNFDIKGRSKSIFSIYQKMKKQNIPFEEVYDIFAIRIIIRTPLEQEKSDCWRVYSIVTDFYHPSPDRLRDWISSPKANGYESLHTTVMGLEGKWVEVQIRTERMDDIAEMGYAAHWKYKESAAENALDAWINKVREMLENPETNAMDFIDDFKLNLFAEEIFVFTPKGALIKLPAGATALDFAYEIHSHIGEKCIGAKVSNRLVPLSHPLKSGDQVEVLTSQKQKPKEDWLHFVVTARAKSKIKASLKEEKRKLATDGKELLARKLHSMKVTLNNESLNLLVDFFKAPSVLDLYYRIAIGIINLKHLKDFVKEDGSLKHKAKSTKKSEAKEFEELISKARGNSNMLVIGEDLQKIEYKLSPCCNPINGDDVFGFITINEGIKIHRANCPNALQLMSNYAYRIVKAKWTDSDKISFLAGIKITGSDAVGIVNNITKIISNELNVNMRSISFDTNDGIFEGTIMVFVNDTNHLTELMKKLKKVNGVLNVMRIDSN
ncbi:MAG TPA: bifunctional (p)ppGpp synthetase/guanosine-3',5'-bis(diphosphate) 3'-pyrophosphohydrolase [Bacteroidia bacterium]|jgi:guanosine-3',5'-bis(diphosphate) 3'-pyrophosphohydrolase|nr:bifunctional (p)ppGpp synthetase/guanosine-3',5'-bis(diphosphate) 3'-pyrophosphohydrolase [Bacteroidia bacterium]HRH09575.1 bifunctional (p)ppGpp synthetase/guanosine-3',5'-bis(diphosphate) 3'-pyrophosphohydrolase [Bacteroidia bacterium]HRH63081.1 bifunctional (p)ppGpp synthetase/guanosine-3',5'-bis(diphosphate) 3'-pyrophosphohydrolase [Bacteroidia bacterium]